MRGVFLTKQSHAKKDEIASLGNTRNVYSEKSQEKIVLH